MYLSPDANTRARGQDNIVIDSKEYFATSRLYDYFSFTGNRVHFIFATVFQIEILRGYISLACCMI